MTAPSEQHPGQARILVFDSGVGGLSIVQHLRGQLPATRLTFLADNRCFPYGMMRDDALIERVVLLLHQACNHYRPDIVVVACNSASTLALPALRETLTIPVVGVVPAIKPAARLTQTGVIGLLATPGTVRRDYTDQLIAEFAPDCEVIKVGSSELVHMAEAYCHGIIHPVERFTDILAPLTAVTTTAAVDTVVLACTHFPLLKAALAKAAPEVRHWVDSGEAIARRVVQLLPHNPTDSTVLPEPYRCEAAPSSATEDQVLLTGDVPDDAPFQQRLARLGFHTINAVDW